MSVKIRLEALPANITAAVLWLKSTGARLTGITHLYPVTDSPELRVYADLTPPLAAGHRTASERQGLAQEARSKAQQLEAAGDAVRAAYYSGLADGLET